MSAENFFGKYAGDYAKSELHASGSDLAVLVEKCNPKQDSIVLDLATGTGFTAVAFAKVSKSVIGLDKTEEMLEEAEKFARAEGTTNISFVKGDVESLPFSPSFCDIVTCRRAAHHFSDKTKFLSEVSRVLKPGGTIAVSDMVSPADDSEDLYNKIERARDPTHVGAKTVSGWLDIMAEAGLEVQDVMEYQDRRAFGKWLHPVPLDSKEGKESRRLLMESSPEFKSIVGFREADESFIKRMVIITARKRAIVNEK